MKQKRIIEGRNRNWTITVRLFNTSTFNDEEKKNRQNINKEITYLKTLYIN